MIIFLIVQMSFIRVQSYFLGMRADSPCTLADLPCILADLPCNLADLPCTLADLSCSLAELGSILNWGLLYSFEDICNFSFYYSCKWFIIALYWWDEVLFLKKFSKLKAVENLRMILRMWLNLWTILWMMKLTVQRVLLILGIIVPLFSLTMS